MQTYSIPVYAIYAFLPSNVHGDVMIFMSQRQPSPASLYDSGLEVIQDARMCEKQVAAMTMPMKRD